MTSAELVAALRDLAECLHGYDSDSCEEAADHIERVEALRRKLPCPTCGGNRHLPDCWVPLPDFDMRDCSCGGCPENNGACDGFMSWERIVERAARP